MKNKFSRSVMFSVVVFLSACGSDDNSPFPPKPQPQASTTVMVYMVGSNLESKYKSADGNIVEMLKASLPPNTNVVIETGGANVNNDVSRQIPNWISVKRHVLSSGKIQQISDLGRLDMGAPKTLSDFIDWAQKQYPAGSYKLLMWDHGGGWTGFGGDENTKTASGSNSMLSLNSLAQGIRDGVKASNIHFDVIGFDACLMATVEVATALSPYANYLLASEELEPGPGWNWTSVISSADSEARTFGKIVADSYIAKQETEKENGTLSLIDLQKIGAVQTALESWSDSIIAKASASDNSWANIVWKRATSLGFGGTGDGTNGNGYLDLVDLKIFSRSISDIVQGSEKLSDSISQAVVYNNATSNYSNASGLTAYFPSRSLNSSAGSSAYQAINFSQKYQNFSKNYLSMISAKPRIHEIDAGVKNGAIAADIKADAGILDVDSLLFSSVNSDGTATLVGSMPIYDNVQNFRATVSVTAPLNGGWLTLNGYPLILGYLNQQDGGQIWGAPIELNGELTYLLYTRENDGGWTAIGTASSIKDPVYRVMPLPSADDKIQILGAKFDVESAKAVALMPVTPEFSTGNFDLQFTSVPAGMSQAVLDTDSTFDVKLSDIYPRSN
ncbi:clostripain-related cysteine peptidase [Burkholderia glumae]|uniref:Clostripain-related cysteine peptidase n=3 Tax=Burkholderia glumae TaxID=337 RepID=A0AAQ0BVC6_BURGL|nr:clostripain-related cysteine peptidase [Burkholderia glumae]ACR32639.1 Peptidase C11 clostripain [Burkholderia glumae BGR1]AJY62352.1 clostripain family protein [Burkholderia glumae LMG 2196 = ATCC 33617]MCM2485580.1 clostripain-related cysteine peptidase [Burkholderia glumae]MCM2511549.1 clostripain-related cysteine peptidase [Burkholderia glumae]MCM2541763.1 clostripain-related cysteine peptidase [Burkholderia glumae]